VFNINCVEFWVFPRRLVYIGRRFGTLRQVHIQKLEMPLKMDLTEGTETSANINQTLGKHPRADTVNIEHGESLK
jgi:hypothetical protein